MLGVAWWERQHERTDVDGWVDAMLVARLSSSSTILSRHYLCWPWNLDSLHLATSLMSRRIKHHVPPRGSFFFPRRTCRDSDQDVLHGMSTNKVSKPFMRMPGQSVGRSNVTVWAGTPSYHGLICAFAHSLGTSFPSPFASLLDGRPGSLGLVRVPRSTACGLLLHPAAEMHHRPCRRSIPVPCLEPKSNHHHVCAHGW